MTAALNSPQRELLLFLESRVPVRQHFLRCVAGLERAHGYVHVGNELWQDDKKNIFLPTWQRQLGYVFQESSLFFLIFPR